MNRVEQKEQSIGHNLHLILINQIDKTVGLDLESSSSRLGLSNQAVPLCQFNSLGLPTSFDCTVLTTEQAPGRTSLPINYSNKFENREREFSKVNGGVYWVVPFSMD